MSTSSLLDERVALQAARLVVSTRATDPERSRALRQAIGEAMPAIDLAARQWSQLGTDLPPTTCRVVSRSGWVRANLAGLRGVFDPVAERLGTRSRLAGRVLGAQLGAILGLLSTKVLGQFIIPLGAPGAGQLVVVGPNLLELQDAHGVLADDIHRTILLHEVTHRLQFDGTPWLAEHLRSLLGDYLADTRIDVSRLSEAAVRLPSVVAEVRTSASITPVVELLMSPGQKELLDRAQGLMSLLEGHGMAAMHGATDGVVADPDAVRAALSSRPPDVTARILTAVAGLHRKREQYRLGELFVDEVVASSGIAGLNRAFESADQLPTVDEIADPHQWLVRVGGPAA